MSYKRRRIFYLAATLATLASLGGCVLEPWGEGHRSGGHEHEHEDRNRDEHGGDRRLNYGVDQKGNLGLFRHDIDVDTNPAARGAVFFPDARRRIDKGLWA